MKRNLILTAGLTAALGLSAFGIAQAAGNGAGGVGGNGAPGGGAAQTQTQERIRAEHNYRYEYRKAEGAEYGEGDQLRSREMIRIRAEWKTMAEVTNDLEGAGYKVRKMEAERTRYEAKVTDATGNRLELKINPVSGAILAQEIE